MADSNGLTRTIYLDSSIRFLLCIVVVVVSWDNTDVRDVWQRIFWEKIDSRSFNVCQKYGKDCTRSNWIFLTVNNDQLFHRPHFGNGHKTTTTKPTTYVIISSDGIAIDAVIDVSRSRYRSRCMVCIAGASNFDVVLLEFEYSTWPSELRLHVTRTTVLCLPCDASTWWLEIRWWYIRLCI